MKPGTRRGVTNARRSCVFITQANFFTNASSVLSHWGLDGTKSPVVSVVRYVAVDGGEWPFIIPHPHTFCKGKNSISANIFFLPFSFLSGSLGPPFSFLPLPRNKSNFHFENPQVNRMVFIFNLALGTHLRFGSLAGEPIGGREIWHNAMGNT